MGSYAGAGAGVVEPPKKRNPLCLTESERDAMRRAGAFNAKLMDYLRDHVVAGAVLDDIDTLCHEYTTEHGHVCATLGYNGFTKSCCTSVNDVVCHGIPDDYVLKDGDIVNLDITSIVDGWHGDQSETFLIGDVSDEARAVTQCSFDSMWAAIDALTPSCKVKEIGKAVVARAKKDGFGVVRNYQGHGIGRKFHQDPGIPHIPNHYYANDLLEPGMCFTIEPMINVGSHKNWLDKKDGWTVRTSDGKLSAQFEHTILMTESGPEVLTLTKNGPQRGHKF